MGTGIPETPQGHEDRHPRWERLERAERWTRDGALHAQGLSQRQAAQGLDVPRSTRQAWRADHERLEACPAVAAFFHRVPGLACLHRWVRALHLVSPAVGACGMRLVCLCVRITGLDRLVGASYGVPHQGHGRVEEAIVASRREERARLAHARPAKASTGAQDDTWTGGLCWGGDRAGAQRQALGTSGPGTGSRPLAEADGAGPDGSPRSGDALDQ